MNRMIVGIFSFLFTLCCIAQSRLPSCPKDRNALWTNCDGTLTFANGDKYVGEGDMASQHGIYTLSSESRETGEFKDNHLDGSGIRYDAKGTITESGYFEVGNLVGSAYVDPGQFTNTQPNSTQTAEVERKAVGSDPPQISDQWIVDARNGCKVFNQNPAPNETIEYIGTCANGFASGAGVLTWYLNGKFDQKAEGTWNVGKLNGFATYTFANGNKYVGDFKGDNLQGLGTATYANGTKYFGEFKDNKFNGKGTFTFADGSREIGEYKDNYLNGSGIRYDAKGTITESGYFEVGNLVRSAYVDPARFANGQLDLTQTAEAAHQREIEDGAREQKRAKESKAQQPPAVPAAVGKRVAIVIGNAAYKWAPLATPVNDAKDIAAALRESGFETQELLNATQIQMFEATRAFERKALSSDVALIYFAGHGAQVKGKNYLIPVNESINSESELIEGAYDAERWLDMFDRLTGTNAKRVNIMILDACGGKPFSSRSRSTSNGLANMDTPFGTFLSFSCAPGEMGIEDHAARNSFFTKHLLTAIKQPNTPIELVFKKVRLAVFEETKGTQIPWVSSTILGEFFFTVLELKRSKQKMTRTYQKIGKEKTQ
jgi:hypothetical protein